MAYRSFMPLGTSLCALVLLVVACGASSRDGDGAACSANSDCPAGKVCGFLESAACSAKGECVVPPEVTCASRYDVCGCDGETKFATGCGFPSGYVSTPYAATGACAGDAGQGDASGGR